MILSLAQSSPRELRARIRRSQVMGAELKRYWLRVLPYLSEVDSARLRTLLDQEIPRPTESFGGTSAAKSSAES